MNNYHFFILLIFSIHFFYTKLTIIFLIFFNSFPFFLSIFNFCLNKQFFFSHLIFPTYYFYFPLFFIFPKLLLLFYSFYFSHLLFIHFFIFSFSFSSFKFFFFFFPPSFIVKNSFNLYFFTELYHKF